MYLSIPYVPTYLNIYVHANFYAPQRLYKNEIAEIVQVDKLLQHLNVKVALFAQKLANGRFVQTFAFEQKLSHTIGGIFQQRVINQIFDALRR